MTASEPDGCSPAPAKASPPFRTEPVPYTNYPGRYYESLYRIACTNCEWRGPARNYSYAADRLLIQYDQNAHEPCRTAAAEPAEPAAETEAGI